MIINDSVYLSNIGSNLLVDTTIPSKGEIKSKPVDMVDKVAETGIKAFEYTKKAKSLAKKTLKVVDAFDKVPPVLEETMMALKSFKIISGILAVPKLCKSVIRVIKSSALKARALAAWGIIKSVKKIVGAVETVFYYIYKLNLITKASLGWTKITGYIFMPITFISAGLTTYDFGKKIIEMNRFRSELKGAKTSGPNTQTEVAARVCTHLLSQVKSLKNAKVITKDCPLKDRLNGILLRLKSDNVEIQTKAVEEAKMIRGRLKDRISEHVGIAAVDTSLAVAGVVTTILGLTCPPAVIPLTIVALALTVISLASLAYSKFIPRGDIFNTEKKMAFARVFKAIRTSNAAIKALCHRISTKINQVFTNFKERISVKTAKAA